MKKGIICITLIATFAMGILIGKTTAFNRNRDGMDVGDFITSTGIITYDDTEDGVRESGTIQAFYYSYFTDEGDYRTQPGFYGYITDLSIDNTAFIVIDPWSDMKFPEVNENIKDNVDSIITPVVKSAASKGSHIFIFTNDPATTSYNTRIAESLNECVDDERIQLKYYSQYDLTENFCEQLLTQGIKNVIFMGYATEMCVLYRNVGIIAIKNSIYKDKLKLFIVPEATDAMVSKCELENYEMKKNICIMLSQNRIADIIRLKDLIVWTDNS